MIDKVQGFFFNPTVRQSTGLNYIFTTVLIRPEVIESDHNNNLLLCYMLRLEKSDVLVFIHV